MLVKTSCWSVNKTHLLISQVLTNVLFIQQRLPHSHLFLTEILTLYNRNGRKSSNPGLGTFLVGVCSETLSPYRSAEPWGQHNACSWLWSCWCSWMLVSEPRGCSVGLSGRSWHERMQGGARASGEPGNKDREENILGLLVTGYQVKFKPFQSLFNATLN